jgi:5,5'-dehydrodivanillate O-demethylase
MLTPEENERLTRVGPGTPAGEMLRRYWWPVACSQTLQTQPLPVRILGEDLVLFRTRGGEVGLLERACAHRLASLEYGRTEERGIRCCYHGWLYDVAGRCLEQPAEPPESTFKDRIRLPAYQTQEAGGFVFAYLGPAPAPLLPRYDLLFRDDGRRVIGVESENCNWLQRAENGVDEPHLISLHASVYPETALQRGIWDWERTWYGFRDTIDHPGIFKEPRVTHFVFPSHTRVSIGRVGRDPYHDLRLRVPTDDTLTTTFWVRFYPTEEGRGSIEVQPSKNRVRGVYERVDDGWWGLASNDQDRAAQESQGLVTDRSREHLASSDRGIILFRAMLQESIEAVQAGHDPVGVVRDPAQNALIHFDAKMKEIGELVAPT